MTFLSPSTINNAGGYIIIGIHYIIFGGLSGLLLFSNDFFTLCIVAFNLLLIYACNISSDTCPLTLMENRLIGEDSVDVSAAYIFRSKYSSDKKTILQLQLILIGISICVVKIMTILFKKPISQSLQHTQKYLLPNPINRVL
mgnify:CR=1 FL=1|jgi:hypothetical protein